MPVQFQVEWLYEYDATRHISFIINFNGECPPNGPNPSYATGPLHIYSYIMYMCLFYNG